MLEAVSYLAAEPGRHTLGGLNVEAGAVTADDDWSTTRFATPFAKRPVVFAQVASEFQDGTVTARLGGARGNRFRVRLQQQESFVKAGRLHGAETVHYVAISRGTGTLDGRPLRVSLTSPKVDEKWRTLWFGADYRDGAFLAASQSFLGKDPAGLRYRDVRSRRAQVRIQEEKSYDRETVHRGERVGYMVIGAK